MAHTFGGPMYTRPHHWPLTRAIVWAAVTAAALLASTFALSSPAIADETVPPDTTTEPGDGMSITETPTEAPTEPAPTESTPGESAPTESAPTPTEAAPSAESEEDTAKSDGITAAVEPDFGYNKFRVGVQLEDGSVNPDGLTTLGSEITITETGPDVPNGERVTTCTTSHEDANEPTTTFCEDLAPDGLPPQFDQDFYFSTGEGSDHHRPADRRERRLGDHRRDEDRRAVWTVRGRCGRRVADGRPRLESDDDDGDDDGDESDDEESDDPEDGALPNVGAPDASLLGYGAILLAIGSRLIAGGRSRPRHRADGAII